MALTQPINDAERVRWVANLTTLFLERPLLERATAAARAGFTEVECWWPFGATGRPEQGDVDAFVTAITDSGVSLVHMNLFGGDMPGGQRGVVSYPADTDEFQDSVAVAMDVAARTGVRLFNCPYGHRLPGLDPQLQDETAILNLGFAARAAAAIGGTILLEPVSGFADYPLKTAQQVVRMIDSVRAGAGVDNIGFLFDQYHLAMNGDDVAVDIHLYGHRVDHIQLADVPGRHEPGSARFDLEGLVRAFLAAGYTGPFGLEFFAAESTDAALAAFRTEIGGWRLGRRAVRLEHGLPC